MDYVRSSLRVVRSSNRIQWIQRFIFKPSFSHWAPSFFTFPFFESSRDSVSLSSSLFQAFHPSIELLLFHSRTASLSSSSPSQRRKRHWNLEESNGFRSGAKSSSRSARCWNRVYSATSAADLGLISSNARRSWNSSSSPFGTGLVKNPPIPDALLSCLRSYAPIPAPASSIPIFDFALSAALNCKKEHLCFFYLCGIGFRFGVLEILDMIKKLLWLESKEINTWRFQTAVWMIVESKVSLVMHPHDVWDRS